MKVSLNGYFVAHPHTGSGLYTAQLIAQLGTQPGRALGPQKLELTVDMPGRDLGHLRRLNWEQRVWPRAARRAGADLLHSPYFALPLRPGGPTVVTIHDLIPMILAPYRPSRRVRAYTWLQALACRSADVVIADSEYSKRDIVRLLRIPEGRVEVVYLGVEPTFSPDRSGPRPIDLPYVFYIGGLDHRKNLPTLFQAFAQVARQCPDLVLTIAGAPGANPLTFPDLRGPAGPLGERVRFLGRVSDEEKLALYRHAELFVFPSLYEGFGLDPLEALACGCPVVCSDATSLPEIVGDGGILTDARDPGQLAQAMLAALANPEPLRAKGPQQAAKFSWERMATQTAAIYARALGNTWPAPTIESSGLVSPDDAGWYGA